MQDFYIDVVGLVKYKTEKDVDFIERVEVSKDTNFFRMKENEEDDIHVLMDGAGGFQIIINPESENKDVIEGHLNEMRAN